MLIKMFHAKTAEETQKSQSFIYLHIVFALIATILAFFARNY